MKTPNQDDPSVQQLHTEWSYEFEDWMQTAGFFPVEHIKTVDNSESFQQNQKHIFKNLNGDYAVVHESGCSCYTVSDAQIDFVKTKEAALAILDKFEKDGN